VPHMSGFYLIDRGVPQLERQRRCACLPLRSCSECAAIPLFIYLGGITLITAILTGLIGSSAGLGIRHWLLGLTGILSLLCASQLAVALVNWLATMLVKPHPLPRMDFSEGIPPESRALVVIPTMLTSAQNIEKLAEALEVRFLANRDEHLHFGLLTDFRDAPQETMPDDELLLQLAQQSIDALNEKYPDAQRTAFFLFHRPRRWNHQERMWMGYERKRGKLADLNALLRGDPGERFSLIVGETTVLSSVKYVITLDTDTSCRVTRHGSWLEPWLIR